MAASFDQFDDLGSKVAAVGSRRSKIIDEERPRLVLELGSHSGSCCHVTSSNSLPSGSASVVWRTAATPVHDSVHVAPQHGAWTRSLRPHDMEKPQVRADDPNEPPTGFEPVNYALREARDSAPGALPAQIASHVPRTARSAQHAPYSGPRPGQLSVTERYWPEWHWPQGLPVKLW